MRKAVLWTKRVLLVGCGGGFVVSGGCLADNFRSGVLGDTIINGTIAAALANVLARVGL